MSLVVVCMWVEKVLWWDSWLRDPPRCRVARAQRIWGRDGGVLRCVCLGRVGFGGILVERPPGRRAALALRTIG